MGISDKAKHLGDHGGSYTDNDGMRKQFTMIDHDKKSTMFNPPGKPDENWQSKAKAILIERISNISASLCPDIFIDFTIRGEGKSAIEWNMDMLLDAGTPLNQLRDLCTLVENKSDNRKQHTRLN